jgi:hypothetical protein
MIQYVVPLLFQIAVSKYGMPAGACHQARIRATRWRA